MHTMLSRTHTEKVAEIVEQIKEDQEEYAYYSFVLFTQEGIISRMPYHFNIQDDDSERNSTFETVEKWHKRKCLKAGVDYNPEIQIFEGYNERITKRWLAEDPKRNKTNQEKNRLRRKEESEYKVRMDDYNNKKANEGWLQLIGIGAFFLILYSFVMAMK